MSDAIESQGRDALSAPIENAAGVTAPSPKRDRSEQDCPICLEAILDDHGKFVGPCGHSMHIECAESNFVFGHRTTCPCCRCEFPNAPGEVALRRFELEHTPSPSQMAFASPSPRPARRGRHAVVPNTPTQPPGVDPRVLPNATVLPDVAPPAPVADAAPATAGAAAVSVITDRDAAPSAQTTVTAIVRVKVSDDAAHSLPTDIVVVADCSGSMVGEKIEAVRDALLRLASGGFFGDQDRVALVNFSDAATQVAPLAALAIEEQRAAFRRAVMTTMEAEGGTNISAALDAARAVLATRTHVNPMAHILLMSDGQDTTYMQAPAVDTRAAVTTTIGIGNDHDPELLSTIATRGLGTFAYLKEAAHADEVLGAYIGSATHAHASRMRVELRPANGCEIVRVRGPGAVTMSATHALAEPGPAYAGATREYIVEILVPASVSHMFDAIVTFDGRAAGEARGSLTASDTDADTVREALNREVVSAAAAAVAQTVERAGVDVALSVLNVATARLTGSSTARASSQSEIETLRRMVNMRSAETAARAASNYHAMHETQTDYSPCDLFEGNLPRTYLTPSSANYARRAVSTRTPSAPATQ